MFLFVFYIYVIVFVFSLGLRKKGGGRQMEGLRKAGVISQKIG